MAPAPRRLRAVLALEQEHEARMAPLLRAVSERRLHRSLGVPSFAAYARERLGMSPRRARSLVRIERAGDRCAPLREAFRNAKLSWVQADALAGLMDSVSDDQAARWVAHAERVSVRRLQDDVDASRSGVAGFDPPVSVDGVRQTGADATPGADDIPDRANAPPPEDARIMILCPREVAELFRAVLCSLRRHLERGLGRLPSEGEAFEAMLDHALEAWSPPRTRAREFAVFERDGWRCTVPGCTSLRNLHDHHVVFRSRGGSDGLENRTTLCAWHPLRGVHAGVVRCTGRAAGALRFELGLRASGPPLVAYGPGEVRA